MITRPLELATKLRPEPRNFDWLFFVNLGLIGLFFALFGSPFVLAPGLGVNFRLPTVASANTGARPPTHVISIKNSGQIFSNAGLQKMDELSDWLMKQAATVSSPLLLVRGGDGVPISMVADVASAARRAGFETVWAAEEPSGDSGKAAR